MMGSNKTTQDFMADRIYWCAVGVALGLGRWILVFSLLGFYALNIHLKRRAARRPAVSRDA